MRRWKLDLLSVVFSGAVVLVAVAIPHVCIPVLATEAAFAFLCWRKYFSLNHRAINVGHSQHNEPHAQLRTLHDFLHSFNSHACLSQVIQDWFYGEELHHVKKGNLAELLAYLFWSSDRSTVESDPESATVLRQMVSELEAACGTTFTEGHNPSLRFMDHLREDLRISYRPLSFYLFTEALGSLTATALRYLRFRRCTLPPSPSHPHTTHYYTLNLPPPSPSLHTPPSLPPIVFLHGIGVGLMPYTGFLRALAARGHPVIALEFRHISMRWTPQVPSPQQLADALAAILHLHRLPPASIVAHSYGTFVASRLCATHPTLLHSLTLIDPVCFGTSLIPHLQKNLMYYNPSAPPPTPLSHPPTPPHHPSLTRKPPSSTPSPPAPSTPRRRAAPAPPPSPSPLPRPSIRRRLLHGIVIGELHCAAAVSRNLRLPDLNLPPRLLPPLTTVVVAGRDRLVPVREVCGMLSTSHPTARLLMHPLLPHGGFLLNPPWLSQITDAVHAMTLAAPLAKNTRCTPPTSSTPLCQQAAPSHLPNSSAAGTCAAALDSATSATTADASAAAGAGPDAALTACLADAPAPVPSAAASDTCMAAAIRASNAAAAACVAELDAAAAAIAPATAGAAEAALPADCFMGMAGEWGRHNAGLGPAVEVLVGAGRGA